MSEIEKAVQWMEERARNNAYGYSQENRWGPDYDCSSMVISAWEQAGVPVKSRGATYTGNMFPVFIGCGFVNVTDEVNLNTGAGLQRGDVLLHTTKHTAMYIGNGMIAQASSNEYGRVTGGKPGDQTGNEVNIRGYYNFPWQYVLRYMEKQEPAQTPGQEDKDSMDTYYTVKSGDSLWSIAAKELGDGSLYPLLMELNGLSSPSIYPGQKLLLHPEDAVPETPEQPAEPELPEEPQTGNHMDGEAYLIGLRVLQKGDYGQAVWSVQRLLMAWGYDFPMYGADKDFGGETQAVVRKFQTEHGLPVTGTVDKTTMGKLLGY